MNPLSRDLRLFGLDLSALLEAFAQPWRNFPRWPLVRLLNPVQGIRLIGSDTQATDWVVLSDGELSPSRHGKVGAGAFEALQVPEDLVLRKTLRLPDLATAQLRQTLALDVAASSPFLASDTAWGYRTTPRLEGGRLAKLVIASKAQLSALAQRAAVETKLPADQLELWVLDAAGDPPVVIQGFGEAFRLRAARTRRNYAYAMVLVAGCLVLGLAVTPTLQTRLRLLNAVQTHQAVAKQAVPGLQARETFLKAEQTWRQLEQAAVARIDPLRLLYLLSSELSDETFISRLQVEGLKVTISGQTANTAALMQRLGALPGLADVRSPNPAMRVSNSAQERFVIEFLVDGQVFRYVAGEQASPAATPPANGGAS